MRFLFLFAFLPLVAALFDDDPELSLTIRNAGTVDLRGVYLLQEANGEVTDRCPQNITHTTWRRIFDGSIGLPHNTIIQDDERCESNNEERSLRFFEGTDYDEEFNPIGDESPLPELFVSVMSASGFNINARTGAMEAGGRYLMGYEDSIRVCGGMGNFGIGTTAFLMRPEVTPVVIKGLNTTLTPGLKYLLMVPRFMRTYCLYTSDVNGPDDTFRPLPTDDFTPSGDPIMTGEETTEPAPSPTTPRRPPVTITLPPTEPPFPTDELLPSPEVSLEPSISPDGVPTDEEEPGEDEGVCFPGDATVALEDGRRKRMDEIVIGDNIQVGEGKFSTVFAFTHNDASVKREFITLSTDKTSITATAGHFIYINNEVQRIETAKLGDVLTYSTGEAAVITKVSKGIKFGLYNPQTMNGDIIVDGIRATTYTKTVDPRLAHAVLAPVRALFKVFGVDLISQSVPDLRAAWLRN